MPKIPKAPQTRQGEQPTEIVAYRKQVVATVRLEPGPGHHPLLAAMHEVAESLHQQWTSGGVAHDPDDEYARTRQDSSHMEYIEDAIEVEYGHTKLSIEFSRRDEE